MLQELERVLLAKWEEFGNPGKKPEQFLYLLSTGQYRHSKAVLHVLPRDQKTHTLIVKIQKGDGQLPFLANEYMRLKALHSQGSLRELRPSIPRPLYFGRIADHLLLIETYMPGVPFAKHSRRREPGLFCEVATWLDAFHSRTAPVTVCLTEEEIGAYFVHPLEMALPAIQGRPSVLRFLDRFRRRVEDLAGARLPLVFSHNDLSLNNVRFQGDRIAVIDWEFSGYPNLPMFDLLNVYLFFAMAWKRLSYTECFRLAFSPDNELSRLLRSCVRDYVRELGVPPSVLPVLVVQYLISRILLLRSIGSAGGAEETLWCLQAIAEGHVDLETWEDIRSGG